MLNIMYQQPELCLICLMLIAIWDLVWKGIALWYSGKNKQKVWFIALLVLNTMGILPIVYLIWFKPEEGIRIKNKTEEIKKEILRKNSKKKKK